MRIVQTGIILLLGFWIYAPALSGEWLFDDIPEILADPGIHSLRGLWHIWFAPSGNDYFPLTETVRCLQWQLFGKATLGYHLTNLFLHVFSAFLLWRLLARLGVRLAWLGGLLFVVHPLCVESVAWISELKNTLSLPFLLIAMLSFLDYDATGNRVPYLRSLTAFLAALLCKTSVVMFPVIILLYGWWRHGRIRRQDWKSSAFFFGLALVFGIVTMLFQQHLSMNVDPAEMPNPLYRLLRAGLIVAFYLSKIFWPAGLDIVYPRWDFHAAWPWEILCTAVLFLFMGRLYRKRSAWSRHLLFGFLFFLINLAPVLGFVGMIWMNYSWVADHFAYLPMIGLIGLVAAGISKTYTEQVSVRPLLTVVVACAIIGMAWQSHRQARLFSTSIALWTHDLEMNPESWLGYNNLAVVLAAQGDAEGAIRVIQRGLVVRSDQALAYSNLGNVLAQVGRFTDAINAERKAVSLQPDNGLMHNQMGNVLVEAGHFEEATAEYRADLQINPQDVVAHSDLAGVYIRMNRIADALEEGKRAVEADSAYPAGHDNFGLALAQAGRYSAAVEQFAFAASLAPDDPEIETNWGVALLKQGKRSEAYGHFQKAAALNAALPRQASAGQ